MAQAEKSPAHGSKSQDLLNMLLGSSTLRAQICAINGAVLMVTILLLKLFHWEQCTVFLSTLFTSGFDWHILTGTPSERLGHWTALVMDDCTSSSFWVPWLPPAESSHWARKAVCNDDFNISLLPGALVPKSFSHTLKHATVNHTEKYNIENIVSTKISNLECLESTSPSY